MAHRPLDVEALLRGPAQHVDHSQLHDDSDDAQDRQRATFEPVVVTVTVVVLVAAAREAIDGLPHDVGREQPHQQDVGRRGEDLHPVEPVGSLHGRRPLGQPDREQCQPEGRHVHEHVTCVGEQRQAARQEAADQLGHHEQSGQHQRGEKAAPRCLAHVVMIVVGVLHGAGLVAGRQGPTCTAY